MTTSSLFDAQGRAAILARLDGLRPEAARQWGKMEIAQMLAHCQQPLRVATGELKLKRNLIGFLVGRLAKKKLLAPGPMGRNLPTAPQFKITAKVDFASEKQRLTALVRRFGEAGAAGAPRDPHPFFGPMQPGEWDTLQWKHLDHHLRQFGG